VRVGSGVGVGRTIGTGVRVGVGLASLRYDGVGVRTVRVGGEMTGRRVGTGVGRTDGAGVPGMSRTSPASERPARRIG